MYEFEEIVLETFLEKQGQLFDRPVAETPEEADEFLSDCMAVVVDTPQKAREYFEEEGADVEGMDEEELLQSAEVFALPDGRYLIVEA